MAEEAQLLALITAILRAAGATPGYAFEEAQRIMQDAKEAAPDRVEPETGPR